MRLTKTLIFLLTMVLAVRASKPILERPSIKDQSRENPYAGQPAAEQAGRKLFQRECSSCHGPEAQGTARAPGLILKRASPGAIFWILRNGSLGGGMPSFAHLPEAQRWQLVTYLKTLGK